MQESFRKTRTSLVPKKGGGGAEMVGYIPPHKHTQPIEANVLFLSVSIKWHDILGLPFTYATPSLPLPHHGS